MSAGLSGTPLKAVGLVLGCQVSPQGSRISAGTSLLQTPIPRGAAGHVFSPTRIHEGARCALQASATHVGPRFLSWACWPHSEGCFSSACHKTPSRSLCFGGANHSHAGLQVVLQGVSHMLGLRLCFSALSVCQGASPTRRAPGRLAGVIPVHGAAGWASGVSHTGCSSRCCRTWSWGGV